MLAQEPILFLITIYLGLLYGLLYALFQVFPIIFVEIRSIHPKLAGLTFIGLGIGTTIGAIVFYYQTRSYPELAKMWRGHPPPEARLPGAMIGAPLLVASILAVCWTGAYQQIPWYVPEIMAIPLGVSLAILFIAFQVSHYPLCAQFLRRPCPSSPPCTFVQGIGLRLQPEAENCLHSASEIHY
jgi:DHA1 family multidrug resistance protein-like MFS transporter